MSSSRLAVAGVFALSLSPVSPAEPKVEAPVAKRVEHRELRHGATVVDQYYWLRDKSNPEVIQYLEAENAYTDAMTKDLQPFADALYKEMLGRIKQTDLSVPSRRGEYFYYTRTEEGKQYPIQCRRKGNMEAPEEILLDVNELAKGHTFMSLGAFNVSDDSNLLAYTTDPTGFRQYALHVKDLRSGQTLPDTAERVTSVQWAADNKTLFFTTEDPVTKRSDRMFRHQLGAAKPEPMYEEKDELYSIHLGRTRDKQYLVLHIGSTDTRESRYLRSDQPGSQFRVFLAREKKHKYDIDHREGLFYVRTNKNAKNYQIMTTPDSDPDPKNWKVFIPHQSDVLLQGIDLFKNYGVVLEKHEAVNRLRIHDFRTGEWHSMAFPEPVYLASPNGNPEYDTHVYRYSYQSMVTPSSVFDYDMETHKAALLKQQEVLGGYDPDAIRFGAAVGHRAGRCQGAAVHRLQERVQA